MTAKDPPKKEAKHQRIRMGAPTFVEEPSTFRKGQPIDYVAAVEAAYALDTDNQGWLLGILRALRPALDFGFGVCGYTYFIEPEGTRVAAPVLVGCPPGFFEAVVSGGAHLPSEVVRRNHLLAKPCASLLDTFESLCPEVLESPVLNDLLALGIGDQTMLRARNADLSGAVFSAPSAERRSLPVRRKAALVHVATHVAAGQRLRRVLQGDDASKSQPDDGTVDAVLTPEGKAVHAESDAKKRSLLAALTAATRSRAESRGALRVERPERALELWQGLVQGRWSLVDTVDSDGKRFVLARRNAPRARAFESLDADERCILSYAAFGHSDKDIAYVLGRSTNEVGATLSRGLRKLRLRSRGDLARVFGAQLFPRGGSKPK